MSSQIFILTSVTKTTGKSIYDDGSILRALFTPIGGVLRNLKEKNYNVQTQLQWNNNVASRIFNFNQLLLYKRD